MIYITVLNPSTNQPVVIETDVTTWGALKDVLEEKEISTDNMKGLIRQTKVNLEDDGAQLPTTDFTLYLFPIKNKAGENIK